MSLRRGDARAAGSDLDRFALVVTDLCPEERALIESIRSQIACGAINWQLWLIPVKAIVWLVSHFVLRNDRNPLNYTWPPLHACGGAE